MEGIFAIIAVYIFIVWKVLMITAVSGSSQELTFTYQVHNPTTFSWESGRKIKPRHDVKLTCSIPKSLYPLPPDIKIFRLGTDDPIRGQIDKTPTNPNMTEYSVELKRVSCDDTDTYVCEIGQERRKTIDIGVYECPPRHCLGNSKSVTSYVNLEETKTISLCIRAFPNISDVARLNDMSLRVQNSILRRGWNWDYKSTAFDTHEIFLTIHKVDIIDYGEHSFTVYSSQAGGLNVKYTIVLEKSGWECLTDLKATNQGEDYISLSWKRSITNEANQPYSIFYKTMADDGDKMWGLYNLNVWETSVTVTDLKENTEYIFSVTSNYRTNYEESKKQCNVTITAKTGCAMVNDEERTETFTTTSATTTKMMTTTMMTTVTTPMVEETSHYESSSMYQTSLYVVGAVIALDFIIVLIIVIGLWMFRKTLYCRKSHYTEVSV